MEIINKNTDNFTSYNDRGSKEMISFSEKKGRLSKAVADNYKSESDLFIHFVVDIDRLYYFINNDENGLKLFKRKAEHGFYFYGKTVRNILLEKMPSVKFNGQYPVRKCPTKINGNVLTEVMVYKKIN